MRLGVIRLDAQDLPAASHGFVELPLLQSHDAQIVIRVDGIRPTLNARW